MFSKRVLFASTCVFVDARWFNLGSLATKVGGVAKGALDKAGSGTNQMVEKFMVDHKDGIDKILESDTFQELGQHWPTVKTTLPKAEEFCKGTATNQEECAAEIWKVITPDSYATLIANAKEKLQILEDPAVKALLQVWKGFQGAGTTVVGMFLQASDTYSPAMDISDKLPEQLKNFANDQDKAGRLLLSLDLLNKAIREVPGMDTLAPTLNPVIAVIQVGVCGNLQYAINSFGKTATPTYPVNMAAWVTRFHGKVNNFPETPVKPLEK